MAKTLNQFLEQQAGYLKVKNPDEQKFVDKHVVVKHPDRNGNGDEVFNGSKVKKIDRRKERHGYEPGEDEKVYEELKGNQHKIDANKNGKVDAHDFKLLRSKKKIAEGMDRVVDNGHTPIGSATQHAAKLISSHTKRKHYFDGGDLVDHETDKTVVHNAASKPIHVVKKLAKDYHAGVKEEAEQIDELDTATLKSYRTKARAQGNAIVDKMKMGGGDWSKDQKDTKTLRKRAAGAQASGKQLVKRGESLKTEEVEQIDEISTAAKDSYVKKAVKQLPGLFNKSGKDADAARKYYNRKNTVRKIANEEVEQVDEKINLKKASMGTVVKDFQKSDAPQFKGKSQEKRRVMAIAAKLTAERGGKPLRKEERLAQILTDLSESHKNTMLSVFNKLNEDNQKKFLQACETEGGIERMLDFSISHRGE